MKCDSIGTYQIYPLKMIRHIMKLPLRGLVLLLICTSALLSCDDEIIQPVPEETLESGGLRVRVTTHDENVYWGLNGAQIRIQADSLYSGPTTEEPICYTSETDTTGRAVIAGIRAGRYLLQVDAIGHFTHFDTLSIESENTLTRNYLLERRPGTLRITVIDESNLPVDDAMVILQPQLRYFGSLKDTTFTDGSGDAWFSDVTSGLHGIHVWYDDSRYHYEVFQVAPDVISRVIVKLEIGENEYSHAGDTMLSAEERTQYRDDAARLILRWLEIQNDMRYQNIEIPIDMGDGMYSALLSLHNTTSIASRDTVIDHLQIHTFPNPDLYLLNVRVVPDTSWVEAWKNGQLLTGNAPIDTLIVRYGLTIDKPYSQSPSGRSRVRLRSPRRMNIEMLGREFEVVPGVISASPVYWVFMSQELSCIRIDSDWVLVDFMQGWGDCMAGCIHHRYWRFQIFSNHRVVFVGSWGDGLDEDGLFP